MNLPIGRQVYFKIIQKMLKQVQHDKKKWICVDIKEIRNNKYDLSISRYKPIEYEEVEYEKPDVIMEKVLKLEKDIEMNIKKIKKIIPNGKKKN